MIHYIIVNSNALIHVSVQFVSRCTTVVSSFVMLCARAGLSLTMSSEPKGLSLIQTSLNVRFTIKLAFALSSPGLLPGHLPFLIGVESKTA